MPKHRGESGLNQAGCNVRRGEGSGSLSIGPGKSSKTIREVIGVQKIKLQEQDRNLEMIRGRFDALENQVSARVSKGPNTKRGEKRSPALVLGGWDENQEVAETLSKAEALMGKISKDINIDIPVEDMLVPGLTRGYAIIPSEPWE